MTADLEALDLPQLFTPAQAAEILRYFGLTEITESALRTRAYRRQIPFHLNGRRIRFTATDLREIIEGQARRPLPSTNPQATTPSQTPPRRHAARRSSARAATATGEAWRAREPSPISTAKPEGR